MALTHASVRTESASKYLAQLCKHFAHKVPAKWTSTEGEVTFPFGFCRITAGNGLLSITCEAADTQNLERLKAVLDNHLERFAWREDVKLIWS